MTRKHFTTIAWTLRQSALRILDETTIESDARSYRQRQWDLDVIAMADACSQHNGAFDRGRFMVAAGYTHRPDGSMFPMAAPR
ncbi:MAG: hypothetical protein QOF49_862 [Chloroflexota bacterium]|jgi:hypothetical protein|nr:hypothetical protein [Chloroflexota bacterium]